MLLAVAQRSPAPTQTPKACGKPFAGNPPLSFELPSRYSASGSGALARLRKLGDPRTDPNLALALTALEYNDGQIAAARRSLLLASARLGADDTRVSVATAMLGWTPRTSDEVERTLEGIASDSPNGDGLPLVERGIVALWRGCTSDASDWLTQARTAGPDGFYGVLADDLLHLNQLPKYPVFVSSVPLPGGSLETRRRAAAAHPDSARLALAYAVSLQEVGRRAECSGRSRAGCRGRSEVDRRAGRRDRPRLRQGQPRHRRRRARSADQDESAGREPGLPPRAPAALDQAQRARGTGVREGGEARSERPHRQGGAGVPHPAAEVEWVSEPALLASEDHPFGVRQRPAIRQSER